ncbi:hypothetical protein, partial [Hymenobacter terricola]|uniref:hypothetical protein n=1 Tax=Hymenobacter terricola TaxID=2819236 RepID=UPI001CF5F773
VATHYAAPARRRGALLPAALGGACLAAVRNVSQYFNVILAYAKTLSPTCFLDFVAATSTR